VDFEEAFAELGLKPPTSADALRRAYLKAVRAHSPERDPEGFQRVRKAYDLLRSASWRWAARPASEAELPDRSGLTVPAPSKDSEAVVLDGEVVRPVVQVRVDGLSHTISVEARADADVDFAYERPFAEAVAAGKLARASELLLERLSAPLDVGSLSVTSWRALDLSLQLLEEGDPSRARRVFEALEQRTTALGVGKDLGPVLAARSMLLGELLALESKVPDKLIVALAEGVRHQDFDEAVRVFDALRSKQWSLGRIVKANAPRLRRLLGIERGSLQFGPGWPRWSWLWVAYVILQGFYSCLRPGAEPTRPASHAHASTTHDAGARLQPEDSEDRKLVRTAAWIDDAVRAGDCTTVREQWPYYVRAVRSHPESRDNYAVRREQAFHMCNELANELSETP